jgi:glyoxylase-like metal-dependent hydrolase (beta-lactamase superfamily II)/lambda repressor-like predicted transcriptional regulator
MPGLEDELGDVVAKARTGAGLSLADLAARSGLTESELKAVEVYTGHPDAPQVRRLAAALDLRPDALWDLAQDSWSAPEVPWSIGDVYGVDCLTSDWPEHCYVVTAPSGECLIVDPGDEAERIVGAATRDGRRPLAILITHRHRDHTGAVVPVQRATGVPVYVEAEDVEGAAGVPADAVRTFAGDTVLEIGPFAVRALATPGHTPGSVTYVLEGGGVTAAFCGDTLFAGSAGRAGHSYQALRQALRQKLVPLPPETILYPGHGPATTLANELARNPFL